MSTNTRAFLCVFTFLCIFVFVCFWMFRGSECQVLDYQTQQLQVLPLLASAYVLTQLGYYISRRYNKIQAEVAVGKLGNLQEVR